MIGGSKCVMSAAVYDVGHDTRMLKKRKNMIIIKLLAAIKNETSLDIDRPQK